MSPKPPTTDNLLPLTYTVASVYTNLVYFSSINGMIRLTFLEANNTTESPVLSVRTSVILTGEFAEGLVKQLGEFLARQSTKGEPGGEPGGMILQ